MCRIGNQERLVLREQEGDYAKEDKKHHHGNMNETGEKKPNIWRLWITKQI